MHAHASALNEQAEALADYVERIGLDLHERHPLLSEVFGISTFEVFIRLVILRLLEFPLDLLEKVEDLESAKACYDAGVWWFANGEPACVCGECYDENGIRQTDEPCIDLDDNGDWFITS